MKGGLRRLFIGNVTSTQKSRGSTALAEGPTNAKAPGQEQVLTTKRKETRVAGMG